MWRRRSSARTSSCCGSENDTSRRTRLARATDGHHQCRVRRGKGGGASRGSWSLHHPCYHRTSTQFTPKAAGLLPYQSFHALTHCPQEKTMTKQEIKRRYNRSDKGRAADRRYRSSPKGIAARNKFNRSKKYKVIRDRYYRSAKCKSARKKWRDRNKSKLAQWMIRFRDKLKNEVFGHYGKSCQCCGESNSVFLAIDHVDGSGGSHRRSLSLKSSTDMYRWLKRNNWPQGFQTLCYNCNWAKHRLGKCPHQICKSN